MRFKVHLLLGWQWRNANQRRRPCPLPAPLLNIPPGRIDVATEYAGSYHILEMGRHFDAYSARPYVALPYRYTPMLPRWMPAALMERARAADVTGNSGEIIAGLIARRLFKVRPGSLVHLRARVDRRTPDYVIDNSPQLLSFIAAFAGVPTAGLPAHWPIESKAGIGLLDRRDSEAALRQILAYWHHIRNRYSDGVGYGLIVTTELTRASITVSVLMPHNASHASALTNYLRSCTYEQIKGLAADDLPLITRHLRGFDG
jgi:hypothetical protein